MRVARMLYTLTALCALVVAAPAGADPDKKDHEDRGNRGKGHEQQEQRGQHGPPQDRSNGNGHWNGNGNGNGRWERPAPAPNPGYERHENPAPGRPSYQPEPARRYPPQPEQQPYRGDRAWRQPAYSPPQPERRVWRQPAYSPPQPQRREWQYPEQRIRREQRWTPPARGPVSRSQVPMVWQRYRSSNWRVEHRSWRDRGGYRGYRIPYARFSLYFGPRHRFNLSSYQVRVIDEYPQFEADGYWFELLEPVPDYWPYDWYETDPVTIIELQDGYYLRDLEYPEDLVPVEVYGD